MMIFEGSLITAGLLVLLGAAASLYLNKRGAADVLNDLSQLREGEDTSLISQLPKQSKSKAKASGIELGLLTNREVRQFQVKQVAYALLPISIIIPAFIFIPQLKDLGIFPPVILSLGSALLIYRVSRSLKKQAFIREIEFMLPVVMERLVMGAEAGLDVIASIKRTIELEHFASTYSKNANPKRIDPVSALLKRVYLLTESGISFDKALTDVSEEVACPALRHAFIHLGEAYTKGGEIVMPLRELSDSTQQYYQETVEEEIAKLPVKATMPLACTFTGLLIVFITSPLMQVMKITSEVTIR